MSASAQDIARLVHSVQKTEQKYLLHGPRHDPVFTPWMPYQQAEFIGMLWECMPLITDLKSNYAFPPAPEFLDVGCGPGTKMQIARDLFGFHVTGVEIDTTMVFDAAKLLAEGEAEIEHADALTMGTGYYGQFDLIWLYRPFRDPDRELALEILITESMKPGAVIAGGSWELNIPGLGWIPVVDDDLISPDGLSRIWRGAWQKPETE